MRKIWISFLILSSISIVISGCINNESSENNSTIPIHEGEVILTIWLDEYNYTTIPEELFLHLKLKNIGTETVEYDEWLDSWINIELTYPNGSSRQISEWANSTGKTNKEHLEPGYSIEWSRRITYENISCDYFDPEEFNEKGTYAIQAYTIPAISGDIKSNNIEIEVIDI